MYIIWAILAFSILIIGHEFGHFIMAKLNGVKVEEFAIGMGPKLFGISSKETLYSLRILPIGGYVKMLGDTEKSTDPRALNNKSPLRKLSIVIAGPIANFILAIIFFALTTLPGLPTTKINVVQSGSPAETAGIQKGDKIVNINGKNVSSWDDITTNITANKGKTLNLTVLRDNENKELTLTPKMDKKENRYMIGIAPSVETPSFFKAASYGFSEIKLMISLTGDFFKTLFAGKASYNDFGGPITVIKLTATAAKTGLVNLCFIAGYISIQLAIFNIIPFPALDGGYIIIFLYELITRKEVDENKIGFVNYIGFILLMVLMVLVTIKDVLHPIKF